VERRLRGWGRGVDAIVRMVTGLSPLFASHAEANLMPILLANWPPCKMLLLLKCCICMHEFFEAIAMHALVTRAFLFFEMNSVELSLQPHS